MTTAPRIIASPRELYAWSTAERDAGRRVALVPTMGYLHEGHLSLARAARAEADRVIVSIFVNPTQFGPGEDLDRYPRDLARDLELLAPIGVDVVFHPQPRDMYPPGHDTFIAPDRLGQYLCGAARPTHFRGVDTVVYLLFAMSRCHVAYFGEKDYQQLQIIRRMARDLWLDVEVRGMPIVREPDGLAMSSRNVNLAPDERRQALVLSRALARVAADFEAGERDAAALVEAARAVIAEAPSARVDYVEVADAESLAPVERVERDAVCALAVFFGGTRLIDNRLLRVD